jgi:hypothetical protein
VFIRGHLKKQSQFAGGEMNVTVYCTKDYANEPRWRDRKNKAKQTHKPAFGRKH